MVWKLGAAFSWVLCNRNPFLISVNSTYIRKQLQLSLLTASNDEQSVDVVCWSLRNPSHIITLRVYGSSIKYESYHMYA